MAIPKTGVVAMLCEKSGDLYFPYNRLTDGSEFIYLTRRATVCSWKIPNTLPVKILNKHQGSNSTGIIS
jgi:hypothetical protein